MLELIKETIHRNHFKSQAGLQITLDDDFIVPDTMSDMAKVLLRTGEIQIESARVSGGKVDVIGKMDFKVLYQKEEGGLQTMAGSIDFEELVNVADADERDYVSTSWKMEDLKADMINSRKLGIRAIVSLEVALEEGLDVPVTTGAGGEERIDGQPVTLQQKTGSTEGTVLDARKKDTFRIREHLTIPGTKPDINKTLWTELTLRNADTRLADGKLLLSGELSLFLIYEGEGEAAATQWLEEGIPFSGEIELPESAVGQIPLIQVRLIHKDVEEQPDYDGEVRELDIDAALELDIRLYHEVPLTILQDLYSTDCEAIPEMGELGSDRILTHTTGKCRLSERQAHKLTDRILQICHSIGTIRIDETERKDDKYQIEGVLEVQTLFLTDRDDNPIQSSTEVYPFHYDMEVTGIDHDCLCYLNSQTEQLSLVMLGGDQLEMKAVLSLELLVMKGERLPMVTDMTIEPLDTKKLQDAPGIVAYVVQEGDDLWSVAKRFHTSSETILETNDLATPEIHAGDLLVLVKELGK